LKVSELILFTLNAIVIYLVTDRLVRMIERRRGGVMKQRQVVFFVIFLVLALVTFQLLQMVLGKPGGP
jgi:predicted PurR-regulated permease PerM